MSRPAVESTLFRARRRLTEEYDELVTGARCQRVQSLIATAAETQLGTRESRRLSRHLSHCQPCRREAMVAGLDSAILAHVPLRRRAAAKVGRPVPIWVPRPCARRRGWRRGVGHARELVRPGLDGARADALRADLGRLGQAGRHGRSARGGRRCGRRRDARRSQAMTGRRAARAPTSSATSPPRAPPRLRSRSLPACGAASTDRSAAERRANKRKAAQRSGGSNTAGGPGNLAGGDSASGAGTSGAAGGGTSRRGSRT